MLKPRTVGSYEAISRSRHSRGKEAPFSVVEFPRTVGTESSPRTARQDSEGAFEKSAATELKRGHAFSYAALFAFTLVLYARPSEFSPSAITASSALIVGLVTLGFFVPTHIRAGRFRGRGLSLPSDPATHGGKIGSAHAHGRECDG